MNPENIEAGKRLNIIRERANIIFDNNPLQVIQFFDTPIESQNQTPRQLALESDSGFEFVIKYMDERLVCS